MTFELRSWEEIRTEGTSWTDSSGVTHHSPPTVPRELQVEHRIFTIGKDGRVIRGTWKLF